MLFLLCGINIGMCAAWGLWWFAGMTVIPATITAHEAWNSMIEAALEVLNDESEREISGKSGS